MSSLIKLAHVSKWFDLPSGRYFALNDINIDIQAGEYVAIVGKSGSGKSTLLNMLSGIDHPDSGEVNISGTNIHQLNESKLAAWRGKNIGIVFQFFQLIPTLTIMENLLLAMDFVSKIPNNNRINRSMQLLEQVNISAHANKLPAELSGGEQQRAAIARALANDPEILIADEPTGNLDSKTAAAIHSLFVDLVSYGKTVIVVTHENTSSASYKRIINIKDGAITNTAKELV